MEATIGVYHDHEKAVRAVKYLVKHGIPDKEISIIGKGELVEDHLHVTSIKGIKKAPVPIGVVAGATLGILAGAGTLAVPGLGFLFLAGKFVGALGGITMGLAAGGLTNVLLGIGFKKDQIARYKKHLDVGDFMVIVDGPEEDIEKANKLLHKHGTHKELH